jgi:hypothetical protein
MTSAAGREAQLAADEGAVHPAGAGWGGSPLEVFEEGEDFRAAGFGLDEGAGRR